MPKLPLKVERSAALSVLVIVVLTASVAALTPMAVAQSPRMAKRQLQTRSLPHGLSASLSTRPLMS